MNKLTFFNVLRYRLRQLPQSDVDRVITYYDEMISDRMEEGLSEEQAVAAMGDVEIIVKEVLYDQPFPDLVKASFRNNPNSTPDPMADPQASTKAPKSNKTLIIVLIVLSSPIWLPILAGLIGTIFGIVMGIGGILIGLAASLFSIVIGALVLAVLGVYTAITGPFLSGLFMIGVALICLGLTLFLAPLLHQFALWVIEVLKKGFKLLKKPFVKKVGGKV